jgi:hypothetical protein
MQVLHHLPWLPIAPCLPSVSPSCLAHWQTPTHPSRPSACVSLSGNTALPHGLCNPARVISAMSGGAKDIWGGAQDNEYILGLGGRVHSAPSVCCFSLPPLGVLGLKTLVLGNLLFQDSSVRCAVRNFKNPASKIINVYSHGQTDPQASGCPELTPGWREPGLWGSPAPPCSG